MYGKFTASFYKNLSNRLLILVAILLCSTGGFFTPALAKTSPANNPRYASLVVDADTGTVLHEENADKYRYPASLTKMMTLYLTFEALHQGTLQMDQMLPVSAFAASRPRMNMALRAGQKISVRDAVLSVIVRSANDSAVVLAEKIGGSESAFADIMTERAKTLGMMHTAYRNASGLPNPEQKTTAYDLARLAIALRRDFPEYYSLFSRTSFTYNNRVYQGHNRITSNYPGCDGLKTGFVNASGFNLVSSAKRGDTKVVAVVMGGQTAQSRDRQMVALLDKFLGRTSSSEGTVISKAMATDTKPAIHKVSYSKARKHKATMKRSIKRSAPKQQQATLHSTKKKLKTKAYVSQQKGRTADKVAEL